MKGRLLHVSKTEKIIGLGYKLFFLKNNKVVNVVNLASYVSIRNRLLSFSSLSRRMLRLGVHKILKSPNHYLILVDKIFLLVNHDFSRIENIGEVKGSRPLYMVFSDTEIIYGEYKSNPSREPINIWSYSFSKKTWMSKCQVKGIRHIHGVFSDKIHNRYWITTGDKDEECFIYYSEDDFTTLKVFLSGSQAYRAIYLNITKDIVEYGTDAPDDKNYIYQFDFESKKLIDRTEVGGPVFYGVSTNAGIYMSTAVEPSEITNLEYAEVWFRTHHGSWRLIDKYKKDIFPMKLFQYAQLTFPEVEGIIDDMYVSTIACIPHEKIFKLEDSASE